jgi:hypothetical protein
VERWTFRKDPQTGKTVPFQRKDFFGLMDVVAIDDLMTLGIQATSSTNHAAHVKKAEAEPMLRKWLGNQYRLFQVWSWRKIENRWTVRKESLW